MLYAARKSTKVLSVQHAKVLRFWKANVKEGFQKCLGTACCGNYGVLCCSKVLEFSEASVIECLELPWHSCAVEAILFKLGP